MFFFYDIFFFLSLFSLLPLNPIEVYFGVDMAYSVLYNEYIVNQGKNLTIPCGEEANNKSAMWIREGKKSLDFQGIQVSNAFSYLFHIFHFNPLLNIHVIAFWVKPSIKYIKTKRTAHTKYTTKTVLFCINIDFAFGS